jgi:hypothetical protein
MDVTANLVTPTQLGNWMTAAIGTDRANVDQWCAGLVAISGCPPCPAPELFGYSDANGNRSTQISADSFLESLRSFQLSMNASNQGPGGSGGFGTPAGSLSSTPGAAPDGTSVSGSPAVLGAGLLGPTNCQFCIWLRKNPWALALVALAVYFGFFYKK